jgi:hypothetical protein
MISYILSVLYYKIVASFHALSWIDIIFFYFFAVDKLMEINAEVKLAASSLQQSGNHLYL